MRSSCSTTGNANTSLANACISVWTLLHPAAMTIAKVLQQQERLPSYTCPMAYNEMELDTSYVNGPRPPDKLTENSCILLHSVSTSNN